MPVDARFVGGPYDGQVRQIPRAQERIEVRDSNGLLIPPGGPLPLPRRNEGTYQRRDVDRYGVPTYVWVAGPSKEKGASGIEINLRFKPIVNPKTTERFIEVHSTPGDRMTLPAMYFRAPGLDLTGFEAWCAEFTRLYREYVLAFASDSALPPPCPAGSFPVDKWTATGETRILAPND